jgi:tetraacyldisaccharide 4'-kinase
LKFSGDYFDALISGRARGIGPALLRPALQAASVPYSWAVHYRNRLYDRGLMSRIRVPAFVVSVGNLTLGGTGKTPCVEYVARFYRRLGIRVAILSRGYGAKGGRNDEALVLEESLPDVPHLQGKDRVALAQAAIANHRAEILVLDDGFQHRRLVRDVDLVLLDATNPFGNGYLFPRGILREPPACLRRAGGIVLTHCDQVDPQTRSKLRQWASRIAPAVPVAETIHRPIELRKSDGEASPLEVLREKPVAAFCGIGNPQSFRRTLENLGTQLQSFRLFPDHHAYSPNDIEELQEWAHTHEDDCLVVTTQKDLVKLRLPEIGGRPLAALKIGLHVKVGQDDFDRLLQSAVADAKKYCA